MLAQSVYSKCFEYRCICVLGGFFFSVFVVVVVCFVLFLDSGLSVELFTTIKVMHTFFFFKL